MPVNVRGYYSRGVSMAHIPLQKKRKRVQKVVEAEVVDPNMSAAKRDEINMKKSILWRGNMVQVLLGKKGPDGEEEERPSVVRLQTHDAKLVKIDCGGEVFITTEASLSRYPNTLLGDPERRAEFYDPKTKMYYFDRNQDLFNAILYFYQSPGTFRAPESVDPVVVEDELEFFGIDLHQMIEDYDQIMAEKNPPRPPSIKESINRTITDPSYNKLGLIWGSIDLVCILLTISLLVVETIPTYKVHFQDPFKVNEESGKAKPYKMVLYMMDVAINLFFTLDLVIKFLSSANKRGFFLGAVNIMDTLAIAPFYVELIIFITTSGEPPPHLFALKVLRVCRIVRVVRVLKLVRHSKQLTEVMEVVSSAKQEFFVLIGVVSVVILLVGTIMYFVEHEYTMDDGTEQHFKSILHGCWWAIVTITTVGYGDMYPQSSVGRLTGSFVVLFGIVVLAFPMTIIISKFQDSFTIKKLNANKEMTRKLREMALSGHLGNPDCNHTNDKDSTPDNPDNPTSTTPQTVNGEAYIPPEKQGACEEKPADKEATDIPAILEVVQNYTIPGEHDIVTSAMPPL